MAWDDEPPTAEELKKKPAMASWDAEPPKPEELAIAPTLGDKALQLAGNVGANALDWVDPRQVIPGIRDTFVEGAYRLPRDMTATLIQKSGDLATGKNSGPSPMEKRMTDIVASEPVQDPAGFAFKRPLDAASILLGPILPFLGEGAGLRSMSAAKARPPVPPAGGISFPKRMAAKAISVGLGAPEEAVIERMKNPAGVKTAFSHKELAEQMTGSVKNLSETIGQLDTEARTTLRSSPFIEDGAIPKVEVNKAINSARRDLGGVFSEDSQKAAAALKRVSDRFKKLRNTVSEQQVKDLINQLDNDIDWDNPAASKTNEALVGVRTRLDGMLKKQNPHYAEAMKPVAEAVRTMEDVQKKFGIKRKTGQGFIADDQAVNRIRTSLKEDKIGTRSVLKKFQDITGEDWETKIRNANVSEAFTGEKTQGSRRAVIGGTIGGGAGYLLHLPPWITSAIGTATGAFADIYGRRMAGRIADVLATTPSMRQYLPQIQRAAAKGPKVLAALHAELIQTDPDYTAAMAGALRDDVENSHGAKR